MSELLEGWKEFTSQFTAIFLTTIVICAICITYNVKVKGKNKSDEISGYVMIVDMIVSSTENLVVSIMGKKYRSITPYFLYIFFYIFIGSMISLLGFESPTTSLTITFSMALVTFVMIYYFGIKYQRAAFFKKFKNPLELFTQFTPLLSMSFRLFGNILGGSIILGLVYALFIGFQSSWSGERIDGHWPSFGIWNVAPNSDYWTYQYKYWWSGVNIFTSVITPFLHFYFDIFDSIIQSVVFIMLTLSYWAEAMSEEEQELKSKNPHREKRKFLIAEIKKIKQNKQKIKGEKC
ncbi:F0F1 ATP synthase subunit A [Mesoplasma corruscae]|uniref:F0F1 ATP synthase subunit A n=1 Tax=Mesoplasma corruscae TaxID=216874 RepID=A0A2S5RGW3_9MOLU|nr:F0F1 ATP synthase subunit A [Mesoplasma corruscae]PPE06576.1 F0F1 ATP synthase subunit A [Mesoplasma corruscae]